MITQPRRTVSYPPEFNPTTGTLLGQSGVKMQIDRTFPIEEIFLVVDVLAGSTGPTLSLPDGILSIIKRVNLTVQPPGTQSPRTVVDASGIGLVEWTSQVATNVGRSTYEALRLSQIGSIANNQKVRFTIRIPLVHPKIGEPLRSRMLLPVHTYGQNPILTLDFEQSGTLYSAGSVSQINIAVVLQRRAVTPQLTDFIQKGGGFIDFDLLETAYVIPTGTSAETRFNINTPGQYAGLCFRQYRGGASVTRDVIDTSTTIGAETKWRLESSGIAFADWYWKTLQELNDVSRPASALSRPLFAASTSAGSPTASFDPSPNFGGIVAAGTSFQQPSCTMLDFLTDNEDTANELGSLLDCNVPANSGVNMQVVGTPASVSTNASTMYIIGQRYLGDLSKWQVIQ